MQTVVAHHGYKQGATSHDLHSHDLHSHELHCTYMVHCTAILNAYGAPMPVRNKLSQLAYIISSTYLQGCCPPHHPVSEAGRRQRSRRRAASKVVASESCQMRCCCAAACACHCCAHPRQRAELLGMCPSSAMATAVAYLPTTYNRSY
jgi:hypothetical protein